MRYNKHITKFEKIFNDTQNKISLIEDEVKHIDQFLEKDSWDDFGSSNLGYNKNSHYKRIFEVNYSSNNDFRAFFRELKLNSDYEINESFQDNPHFETIFQNARELSIYYNWLKKSLSNLGKSIKPKLSELTHKQKMLALNYLFPELNKFENKSSLATVLSQILEVGFGNTRISLSYVSAGKNEVRTKGNLKKVNELFKNQGFNEISNIIEEDLEKF